MEQKKKRKSVSDRLKSTLKPDVRALIMEKWSANITARTDETLNLAYNAHLANDTEALGEYLRDLSRFIRQSMGAVPNITRILQGQAKSKEGE
jgi:acyl-CoA reductase-like NAD-dependent aldehyde dehydrogenase